MSWDLKVQLNTLRRVYSIHGASMYEIIGAYLGITTICAQKQFSLVVKEEGSGERRLIFNKQIKKGLIRSSNLTMKTMKNSKGI